MSHRSARALALIASFSSLAALPARAQSQTQFGTSGIAFEVDTTVQFTLDSWTLGPNVHFAWEIEDVTGLAQDWGATGNPSQKNLAGTTAATLFDLPASGAPAPGATAQFTFLAGHVYTVAAHFITQVRGFNYAFSSSYLDGFVDPYAGVAGSHQYASFTPFTGQAPGGLIANGPWQGEQGVDILSGPAQIIVGAPGDPQGYYAAIDARALPACAGAACACGDAIYAPAGAAFGTLLFEDNWPEDGDLDFNDQVVAWRYELLLDGEQRVTALQAHFAVLAAGAAIHNGLYLHLPVPAGAAATILRSRSDNSADSPAPIEGETDLVIPIADDTRDLYGDASGFLNTDPTLAALGSTTEVALTVTFASPLDTAPGGFDTSATPFDLFIARTGDYGHQIHQASYPGTAKMDPTLFTQGQDGSSSGAWFVNRQGLPFALAVPDPIAWPQELVVVSDAYPGISTFASTGGKSGDDWFESGVDSSGLFSTGLGGTVPPAPALFLPALSSGEACE